MANFQGPKTLREFDAFNPLRNLWRNVLIVAIEDAMRIKNKIVRYPEHYAGRRFHELDYVTLPNSDFVKVCEFADLDHNMIRNKVFEALERMNNVKDDMSSVPRKWLFKS